MVYHHLYVCLVYPLYKPRRMYQLDDEVGDLAATIRDEEMKIVQQVEISCRVGRPRRVEEMKMLKILSGCRDMVWSQVAECVFAEEVREELDVKRSRPLDVIVFVLNVAVRRRALRCRCFLRNVPSARWMSSSAWPRLHS